jgi:Flp pilus assembly CpaE family ATPase
VVASFSTVGGAGKTFLASNLASFLALKGFAAVLVDFDLPHGDAVRAAGVWRGELQNPEAYRAFLKGRPTVCGWRAHARSLGAAMLRHRLGFAVVPRDADAPEEIPKADAEDLLAVLRGGFDAVVVDMGVSPGRAQAAAALEAADLVLIVAGQDDKTIAKLAHWREELKKAGSGPERAALVVNRVNELGFYRPRDVAAKLGFPAFHEVPEDFQAARAMDRAGRAAVELADSAAGRALAALFGASVLPLLGPPEPAGSEKPARGGLFGFGRLFARGGSRG